MKRNKYKFKLDDNDIVAETDVKYEAWYLAHHGLHVFDDVYVEKCQLCKQRKILNAIKKMQQI